MTIALLLGNLVLGGFALGVARVGVGAELLDEALGDGGGFGSEERCLAVLVAEVDVDLVGLHEGAQDGQFVVRGGGVGERVAVGVAGRGEMRVLGEGGEDGLGTGVDEGEEEVDGGCGEGHGGRHVVCGLRCFGWLDRE